MKKKVVKQVNKKITGVRGKEIVRTERLEALELLIKEVGLWNMPTCRELGKKFGVSHVQIASDMDKIVSTFDPKELDRIFTEFYNTDKKALNILREIINKHSGKISLKMEAIRTMIKLQGGMSELLESFAKKQKAVDRVQVESINYHITIDRPYERPMDIIKNVKGIKDKVDSNKEAAGSIQDTGR